MPVKNTGIYIYILGLGDSITIVTIVQFDPGLVSYPGRPQDTSFQNAG